VTLVEELKPLKNAQDILGVLHLSCLELLDGAMHDI
jgi:hypothetical protein